jgi:hypothetical protein
VVIADVDRVSEVILAASFRARGAGDPESCCVAQHRCRLEKVARFGQSSLTDQERQVLLRASEIYKRRRS